MSIAITEKDLPAALTLDQAVEAAYSEELADAASKLVRGLPVLIECDKELAPFLYKNSRDRLKQFTWQCADLDGRTP
ncbi:MAG TPA: ATP-binding protein, partial [Gemmataceae bacterium]